MHALIGSRWAHVTALALLLGCSTRDASLGESAEPSATPARACIDEGGTCIEPAPGACSGGTWMPWDCGSKALSCCLPDPLPPEPCETQHVGRCIAIGEFCSGSVTNDPSFACNEGRECCKERIGTGRGGAGGATPAAGNGGS